MTVNPYQPPQDLNPAVGVLSGSHEDLRSVARLQKGVLVCILVYIIALSGQFLLPPETRALLGIGLLLVGLVGAVFVFLLALKLYGTGLGILFGMLSLIPFIGLFVLCGINGKTTSVLRANGVKVGLLGAKLSDVCA